MKMQTISKKICLVGSFFLLLSSIHTTQPAIGDRFRTIGSSIKRQFSEKLPGFINKTKSHVSRQLSSIAQKIGLSREKIVENLLKNVGNLGRQIGEIKTCMLKGKPCTTTQRAAFYTTAASLLALTALAIALTVSAATSKEIDEQFDTAIKQTSQKAQWWSPQEIFTRLSNKLKKFRMTVHGMKKCLITQRCTKTQKRNLYKAAATIFVLVTIAIGLGIGSYIYAEKQKQKEDALRRQEELKAAQKQLRSAEEKKEKSETEESRELAEEDLRTAQEEIKRLLALAPFDDNPAEAVGFRKHVNVLKGKAQTLKAAYNAAKEKTDAEIRELLQEIKTRTGKKAVDIKKRIAEIKEEALEAFSDKIGRTGSFFSEILQETLGVDTTVVLKKMKEAKEKFDQMQRVFVGKGKDKILSFKRQIENFVTFANQADADFTDASKALERLSAGALIGAKFKSYTKLATEKTKLAQQMEPVGRRQAQIRARLDEIVKAGAQEKDTQEIVALTRENNALEDKRTDLEQKKMNVEAQYEIKRITMDYLDQIYVSAIDHINWLNLKPFGWAINQFFQAFGNALTLVVKLPERGGLSFIIPSDEAKQSIGQITRGIYSLGDNLQDALSIQPIITTHTRKVKQLISSLIKAALNPKFVWETAKGAFALVKQNLPLLKAEMGKMSGELGGEFADGKPSQTLMIFEEEINRFLDEFSANDLKRDFMKKIQEAPLKNIPRAPHIALSIVEKKLQPLEKTFRDTMETSAGFIEDIIQSIPTLFKFISDLNTFMKISKKEEPFFNQKIMEALDRISRDSIQDLSIGATRFIGTLTSRGI